MSKGEFNSVTQVKGRENMADTVYFSKIEYCDLSNVFNIHGMAHNK